MRFGIGYDIHRLIEGRKMVLGGVEIPHAKGPEGHSDGDCLLHAVCDAVLGAMGEGDIGQKFPDTDPAYKDIASIKLLKKVAGWMTDAGYSAGNLDCVVILESPRIGPYRDKMASAIAEAMGTSPGNVSIKAKTAEGLGDIGSGNAVAAYAAVLLEEK